MNYMLNEVHDRLGHAGIVRTDAEIESALDSAAVEWSGRNLWNYATAADIYNSTERWQRFLHEPHGVFDHLEVDVEDDDRLYDRYTPDIPGFEGALAAVGALTVRKGVR